MEITKDIREDIVLSDESGREERLSVKIRRLFDVGRPKMEIMGVSVYMGSETYENTYYPSAYLCELCNDGLLNEMIPENLTDVEYLKELCLAGLSKRYSIITAVHEIRINHEIDVISEKGFVGGFLILQDIIRFARSNNVMISPGCGSLPGSLVAYSLGITGVDPIKNNLLFERYLNTERESFLYGIQIDVDMKGKQRILDYLIDKYGKGMPGLLELLDIRFKGVVELSIIKDTIENISIEMGRAINIAEIDHNDQTIYESLCVDDIYGDFRFNNKELFAAIKPESFDELMALISLDRPLPEEHIEQYVHNKRNPQNISYECPDLESLLGSTYGCLIYQEQIMWILQILGGFTPEESDFGRRALSKKQQPVINIMREQFVDGATATIPGYFKSGITEDVANEIYDMLCKAAPCCFNKSHAAAFALLIYEMAWLKYYYKTEYEEATEKYKVVNSDSIL